MSTDVYRMGRKELRHDRRTVSLLTDHMVIIGDYARKDKFNRLYILILSIKLLGDKIWDF